MRRLIKVLVITLVIAGCLWLPLQKYLIHRFGISEIETFQALLLARIGLRGGESEDDAGTARTWTPPAPIEIDPGIHPFRQIGDSLGERAINNNILPLQGAVLFDANGDGRLDVFLPQAGRTLAKATDGSGVLELDRLVPAKPNVLFLNQGNDDAGNPIFKSVQDLAAMGNQSLLREELLVEGKYHPRASLEEDETQPGRIAWGAVSADFNGDGRLDLYVLNGHHGLLMQTHQLGMRVYPARRNLGRGERPQPLVIRQPSFLWGPLTDGMTATVSYGDVSEPEGRNTLYLNLGDRDHDGIPEWQDVSDEAGIGGHYASTSAAVADFDRDGDLDLYVANLLDPDFWGFGDTRFAGQRNQLYLNQLAESGELRFREVATELGVAGLHQEENLPATIWNTGEGRGIPVADQLVDGKQVGERADHSWATAAVDFNDDGWPDLVVANDIGNRLRVYENLQGKGFRRRTEFDDDLWDGCWMGMSSGDLDGDLSEDLFLTNCGSQVMSISNTALLIESAQETNVQALSILAYPAGHATLHHEILSYSREHGFARRATTARLRNSRTAPPDQTQEVNFAPRHRDLFARYNFGASITGLEFAFNAPMFDLDNDGDLDLYMAGALLRGNDGFIGDWSGSPGRLLVNESTPGQLAFRDHTVDYHLFDITDIDYEHNPPRRPSPGTGWHKRDFVYLTDTGSYEGMGLEAARSVTRDLFRLHEAANVVLAGDLNGDGAEDLLVTHSGGYNSVSTKARNLKVKVAGQALAVPAPNKVMKPPTTFEGGRTFVYINGGPPSGTGGHWVRLRLFDRTHYNVSAIGARVLANGALLRRVSATQGAAFGAAVQDLLIGLGEAALSTLEITWPAGDATPQQVAISPPVQGATVCVDRERGRIDCPPSTGR